MKIEVAKFSHIYNKEEKGGVIMAKWCPLTGEKVLYLECLECDEKVCKDLKHEEAQEGRKDGN